MMKIVKLRILAGIISFTAFALAIGHVLKIDTVILSAILVAVAVYVSAQLTARLIVAEQAYASELLRDLNVKVDLLNANGVRHQVIINSISDLSNDELRKLISVQKTLDGR